VFKVVLLRELGKDEFSRDRKPVLSACSRAN